MSPEIIRPGSAGGTGAPDPEPPEESADDEFVEAPELDPELFEDEAEDIDLPTPELGMRAGEGVSDDGAEDEDWIEPAPLPVGAGTRHGLFRRLYFGETSFDFVRNRRWWFGLSMVIILAGAISLGTRGLNLDIEFVGGTAWTVESSTVTVNAARAALTPLGFGGATITQLGSPPKTLEVQAKLPKGQSAAASNADTTKVADALATLAHISPAAISIETVGPSWGSQITDKAIEALIVFFILVSVYISIFFEWRMAFAAIVAMLHDIAVTVGVYSLSGFDVTPDTVVAFLTVLGYSLYDTIVVFDRIRDNSRHLANRERMSFTDLVNLSMNQTLARSINTSLVAILPILSVLVLGAYVLGAQTLEYFGLALIIGLTSGAYSSIFIASPLVAVMKEREPKYRQLADRLHSRGVERVLISPTAVAAGVLSTDAYQVVRRSAARASVGPRQVTEERPGPTASDGDGAPAPARPARQPTSRPATRPSQSRPPAKRRRKGGRR